MLSEKEFADIKYYVEHDSGLNKNDLQNMVKTIEAQQQEINKLKVQNAVYREALQSLHDVIIDSNDISEINGVAIGKMITGSTFEVIEAERILSATNPSNYHNLQDIKALKQAREALTNGIGNLKIQMTSYNRKILIQMRYAIEAIDKAIGGGGNG